MQRLERLRAQRLRESKADLPASRRRPCSDIRIRKTLLSRVPRLSKSTSSLITIIWQLMRPTRTVLNFATILIIGIASKKRSLLKNWWVFGTCATKSTDGPIAPHSSKSLTSSRKLFKMMQIRTKYVTKSPILI